MSRDCRPLREDGGKEAEIRKWASSELAADADKMGLKGSPTQVKNIFALKRKRKEDPGGTLEERWGIG